MIRLPLIDPGSSFLRYWTAITLGGALVVSTVDALLLQRSKSYFTGGFLAVDFLTGPGDIAAFLLLSLIADAAVIGVLAAVVLAVLAGRLGAAAAGLAAGLFSTGALIVADVVSYELAGYVGDLLDLSLSMELAGGSPIEMLAVASSHLLGPALLVAGAGGAAGGLVWLTNRYAPRQALPSVRARHLAVPVLVAVAGLVASTMASAASDPLENGLLRKPAGKVLTAAANLLTDFDRDGFGLAGRMADPAPFDSNVFPYAVDIPGNGIDENGVGGDLPAGAGPYTEPPVASAPWVRRPDVLLIVLESFRADLLGARVNGRPVTPVLESLAARGVSSTRAYSHNGYTAPSRHHLFSGSLLAGGRDGRTLIDDFKEQGYLVAYFSGQDESFGNPELRVGFERADVAYDARQDRDRRYTTFTTPGSLAVPFDVVQERVGAFLEQHGAAPQPLFVYVNFHDTHFPYTHDRVETLVSDTRLPRRAITPDAREALWEMYANTAANVDRAVGEVIDAVHRARGRRPAVVVTADHGESLFEEGFLGHGYALDDVQTRVPLVVTDLPMRIDEPFAQRDLRDALHRALRVPPDQPATPRLRAPEGRTVFQYLGNVNRPRQIAWLGSDGRLIYDFRRRLVKVGDGPWQRSDELTGARRDDFLRLVHTWERMVLARRSKADVE